MTQAGTGKAASSQPAKGAGKAPAPAEKKAAEQKGDKKAAQKADAKAPEKKPAAAVSHKGKGKAFFERADQVAETGNWDFAIEMYIEGIRREPENLDRGHKPLRDVSLKRKAQGGKGPGLKDTFTHRAGKDPLVSLVNAEYLLAKEPGSINYMLQVLKAAKALHGQDEMDLKEVVKWVCDIIMEAQKLAPKANLQILTLLIESYHDVDEFRSALQACEMAMKISPDNPKLMAAVSELSAKYTLQKGKYGQEGDFTKGVKDLDKQKELIQKDMMVKDKRFVVQAIDKAREEYLASPTVPGKINGLVDALCRVEDESYENEAMDVLRKAHHDLNAYQFKLRLGDIRIRQMSRRYRDLVTAGDKAAAIEQARAQLDFELEEYKERCDNYPTDLALKFELGKRLFLATKYDEAIASLQQAQRDPRRHVQALSFLGQSFARKGWYREAGETFQRALEAELTEDRAKEIRYLLGDVLEKQNELVKAQDQFSEVAQMDYNYRDVRKRLDDLRQKIEQQGRQG